MKKHLLILTALSLVGFIAEAQQEKGKLEGSRKDIATAKADLKQAKKDSVAEYHQFRSESLLKVSENNKEIESLRVEKAEKDKEASIKFNRKVKALEEQNAVLRESVNNYRADGNTNWVVFKREFNQKMDELQQSFKESRNE